MNKKLYVGNLTYAVEENQLRALFSADGREVARVELPTDKETGRIRGFAFIEMQTEADAEQAVLALNGHDLLGRALSVSEARPPIDEKPAKRRRIRY